MKPEFLGSLDLRHLDEPIDGKWFTTLEVFSYCSKAGYWYAVPRWTLTDFASIPKPMRAFVSRVGWHSMPSVLHDWLCEKKIVPRPEADRLYRESLEVKLREFINMATGFKKLWRRKGWVKLKTLSFGVKSYTFITRKK